jgi:uncharacterized protein (DUF433 family)
MNRQALLARVVSDKDTLGGVARIRGTRIPVWLVLNGLADGMTATEIINEYPHLTPEDIQATLLYAGTDSRGIALRQERDRGRAGMSRTARTGYARPARGFVCW